MSEVKRLDILDELDEFNTAPEAPSIMESILQEEESLNKDIQDFKTQKEGTVESGADSSVKRELPSDYLPLNSSIQDLRGQVDSRLTGIERSLTQRLDSLSNNLQQRQQPQQTYQAPEYDQDTPVTLGQLGPITQRLEHTQNMALKSIARSELTRAHLEYERYKQANPGFELNPQEIDYAVGQLVQTGKLDQLENTNWRGHFDQVYRPKLDSKLADSEKRIAEMQKEIETLKKRSVPSVPATPVSPAVGRSPSRPTIQSPTEQADDDIVNMKSFRQKGNFKSFGNDLKRKIGMAK